MVEGYYVGWLKGFIFEFDVQGKDFSVCVLCFVVL